MTSSYQLSCKDSQLMFSCTGLLISLLIPLDTLHLNGPPSCRVTLTDRVAPPSLSCTPSPAVTAELPFHQAQDRDEPLPTEHMKTAVSLNSTRLVACALSVTFEMGTVKRETTVSQILWKHFSKQQSVQSSFRHQLFIHKLKGARITTNWQMILLYRYLLALCFAYQYWANKCCQWKKCAQNKFYLIQRLSGLTLDRQCQLSTKSIHSL